MRVRKLKAVDGSGGEVNRRGRRVAQRGAIRSSVSSADSFAYSAVPVRNQLDLSTRFDGPTIMRGMFGATLGTTTNPSGEASPQHAGAGQASLPPRKRRRRRVLRGIRRLIRDRFYLNLASLLVLGVLTLFWIGKFTEHLQDVLTVLAMGGAAGWIAFVANVLRSRRKDHLQLLLDGILAHWIGSIAVVAAAVAFLGWWSTHGAIILDASQDSVHRRIVVRPAVNSSEEVASFDLSAGGERKVPLKSGWSGRQYVVDADGLPLLTAEVLPFRRTEVEFPAALLARSVVLVKPSFALSGTAMEKDSSYTISVSAGGQDLGSTPFTGQTVWVGCRASVDVPQTLKDSWRAELTGKEGAARKLERWFAPSGVGESLSLEERQEIEIRVKKSDDTTWLRRKATVAACRRIEDFPQVVEIDTSDK